ncbi:hypothetical protein [Opitutus terrae]|uniref:Uncharacterized protein n=1 Tax=Opitutus terrae (strain DSM 11246 / JCM 15787 / PB90-1) TaxID=452637 RepID=B1ZSM5_OPITP|nr:hypothetical protein [Opitutus terrae]ACB73882.1 hypothetical protein Oter_0592 [Opitutus terrae PB90-1]
MRFSLRSPLLLLSIVLAGAVAFVLWADAARARRATYVSELAGGASVAVDRASPTGYAGGVRVFIAPERNNDSYQWLLQTQQMLARDEWRVRHVDFDNAPTGREVRSASPYRWWLALVAWFDHTLSIRPLARSVERAALLADPALHILLLLGTAVFVVWRFGPVAGTWTAAAVAVTFPFAGAFVSGQPGDEGWIEAAALWSLLPLLVGILGQSSSIRRWFIAGGIAGGCFLWISVATALPMLVGIALGALLAGALTARAPGDDGAGAELPWRAWALAGAGTTLLAYFVEYAPEHMGSLRVDAVHPLHGIAWLGLGELLVCAERWLRGIRPKASVRAIAALAASLLAVLAIPVLMLLRNEPGLFTVASLGERLTKLPNAPLAASLATWWSRDGLSAALFVTLLPLGLVVLAGWLLVRLRPAVRERRALALVLGPTLVALGFATVKLEWWGVVDSTLIALAVAVLATLARHHVSAVLRWSLAAAGGMAVLLSARVLVPAAPGPEGYDVAPTEIEALIERDLAQWLARRASDAIVLAPPQVTASLIYHGGLRGLGTPWPENRDGFAASVRIASATSIDETLALVQRRGITHIVIPSWDAFLDEYARLGAGQPQASFIGLLHRWMPPRWLRPIAYEMPQIPGFEQQSVVVFEVVDLQDNVVALSRLVEYFVETGRKELALSASYALHQEFADDLGATVARVQAEAMLGDTKAFRDTLAKLDAQLAAGADQYLPWDRRVSLTIVLAQAKQFDQARRQLERCLAEIDEARLRSLTTVPLYRLHRLLKAFGLEISDPRLRDLARELLAPEQRATL